MQQSQSKSSTPTPPASAHSRKPYLAIVPVFNESHSIATLVRRLNRALPEFDVVVINDGSTDDTLKRIPAGTAVIDLPFNLGIGGAMQTGYKYANLHGYEVAVQVDGDGQHRPAQVLKLVEHLRKNDCDLVIGSRFLRDSKYRQTAIRYAGSQILRGIIKVLSGLDITDCTSGFRAANKRAIAAFAHWYPEDYPEPEVILLLSRIGFKIEEVPVRMRQRRGGRSSINLLAGAFYVVKVTICLILDMVREPWPSGKLPEKQEHFRAQEQPNTELTNHGNPNPPEYRPQPDLGGLRPNPAGAGHS